MEVSVIGGSYAGLIAALRLSRELGSGARVRLISERPRFVQRIRLHELAARSKSIAVDLAKLLEGTGVEPIMGRVERIDLEAKRVAFSPGGPPSHGFDRLVLAVGSHTERHIDGSERHGFFLDDDNGAEHLRARAIALVEAGGGQVAIAGGGLTAIELAAELAESFPSLRVKLLSASPIADGYSGPARRYLAKRLDALGVSVVEGVRVLGIDATRAAHRGGGSRADLFALCAGFSAPELARTSGLEVNERGQVLVDASMRSVSHPFVFAAGDCATPRESVGAPIVMACRTASPMARHASTQLAREARGESVEPMRFADAGRCVSLGRHDGVVGMHRPNGEPTDTIVTGRAAAMIKEAICRFTVAQIDVEAWRARRSRGRLRERVSDAGVDAMLPFGAER